MRDCIIIGAGSTVKAYHEQIKRFIQKNNLVVFGVNNIADYFIPDYHIWTNEKRYRDFNKNINPKSKIITTEKLKNKFNIQDCEIVTDDINRWRTAGLRCIQYCHDMGYNKIFVAGMDGYTLNYNGDQHCYGQGCTDSDDFDYELKKDFAIQKNINEMGIKFKIITPTIYTNKNNNPMIMDVTLRDGGYCNDWKWKDPEKIINLLRPHVDLIEVGYIGDSNLKSKDRSKLCAMIDLKYVDIEDIKKINDSYEKIAIEYVRIAIVIEQIDFAIEAIEELSKKYKVMLSIMKCSVSDIDEATIDKLNKTKLEVLYIADSFGNITEFGNNLYKFKGKIGLHIHKNKSNITINDYFDIIDSSLMGLGRGAGNLDTLSCLLEYKNELPEDLYNFSVENILPIKMKSQCGYSYAYHYSGLKNIHPSYVVEFKLNIGSEHEIIELLKQIPEKERQSYNAELAKSLLSR